MRQEAKLHGFDHSRRSIQLSSRADKKMRLKTFIIKTLRKIKNNKKSIILSLILLLFILIICFGIFETVLRIFFPQSWNYYKLSEEFSWELIPNVKTIAKSYDGELINMNINSKGLRDSEYDYEKPPDVYRILVIGDSMTEGQGVRQEEIYSEVLEKRLGKNYEVITAGVKAYGTAHELAFLKKEGLKYNPNLIIIGFCVNDIRDNAANNLYFIQNGNLIENNIKFSYSKKLLNKIKSFANSNIQSYVFLRPKLGVTLTNIMIKTGLASKSPLAEVNQEERRVFRIFAKEPSEETKRGWELTKALLREVKQTAINNNAKIMLLAIPNKEQVNDSAASRFIQTYNLSEEDLDWTNPQKKLSDICQELNIPLLDPLETFRIEIKENNLYLEDPHWSAEGHKLASEELYNALKEKNFLLPN